MSSYLYRTRAMLQFPRYVPTLITRAHASSQNSSTSGSGVPTSGSTKTVSQTGGTKKGDSSVLPKSTTGSDHTNPTKTSADAPALDHDNVDLKNKKTDKSSSTTSTSSSKSSSSSGSNKQTSFMSSPMGQFGIIAVLTLTIYAGYKMISNNNKDLPHNDHYKRATADYQAANTQGTDVKK